LSDLGQFQPTIALADAAPARLVESVQHVGQMPVAVPKQRHVHLDRRAGGVRSPRPRPQQIRMRGGRVFAQLTGGGIGRGLEQVGVDAGAVQQAGWAGWFAGDANQPSERAAEHATPGGASIGGQAHGLLGDEVEPVESQRQPKRRIGGG